MKIYYVVGVLLVLCAGMVGAGSIEDLDYKDKPCLFCWDKDRQVDDFDVTVDADTLEGHSMDDVQDEIVDGDRSVLGKSKRGDKKIMSFIKDNEVEWTKDGSGMHKDTLGRLLTGDAYWFYNPDLTYFEFELTQFCTLEQLESAHERMDYLQAMIELGSDASEVQLGFKAAFIRSERTGGPGFYNGYRCESDTGMCMKVS